MASLYCQVLGPALAQAPAAIQHVHSHPGEVVAEGVFRVARGRNLVARLIGSLLGLPEANDAVRVRVAVRPDKHGECWERTFGNVRLVSMQEAGPPGILVERFGPMEFRFRPQLDDNRLIYRQTAVGLRLGPLRIPLPRWLGPAVAAHEQPGAEPGGIAVHVRITLPLVALLLEYDGEIMMERAKAGGMP